MTPRVRSVKASFPRGDRRALREACLRLADRAWIRLDAAGTTLAAVLTPRGGTGAGLVADLRAEYAQARARRARRAARRPLDAALMSRALELAGRVDARRREPVAELSAERRAEIAALLAEAEAAPPDAGLRAPWSLARKGSGEN